MYIAIPRKVQFGTRSVCHMFMTEPVSHSPHPGVASVCRSQGGTVPVWNGGKVSLKNQKKKGATLARETKPLSVQMATSAQCNELLKNNVDLRCQFGCFLKQNGIENAKGKVKGSLPSISGHIYYHPFIRQAT